MLMGHNFYSLCRNFYSKFKRQICFINSPTDSEVNLPLYAYSIKGNTLEDLSEFNDKVTMLQLKAGYELW